MLCVTSDRRRTRRSPVSHRRARRRASSRGVFSTVPFRTASSIVDTQQYVYSVYIYLSKTDGGDSFFSFFLLSFQQRESEREREQDTRASTIREKERKKIVIDVEGESSHARPLSLLLDALPTLWTRATASIMPIRAVAEESARRASPLSLSLDCCVCPICVCVCVVTYKKNLIEEASSGKRENKIKKTVADALGLIAAHSIKHDQSPTLYFALPVCFQSATSRCQQSRKLVSSLVDR